MLRTAGRTVARTPRRLARTERLHQRLTYSTSSSNASAGSKSRSSSTLAAGVVVACSALALGTFIGSRQTVYNDAVEDASSLDEKRSGRMVSGTVDALEGDGHLNTLVWGSNKANLLSPDDPSIDTFRTPCTVPWLQDVALRDLALHEQHGACVDARGDVYQWGDAYFGRITTNGTKPEATLQGKDIISVQVTATRVYALSASGKVYALPAARDTERSKASTSSSWFGFGGSTQDSGFTEILPKQELGRRERFVSISAGSDHLLALTSLGRTYALPLSPNANAYGQLGFRRFEALSPSSSNKIDRVPVELVPKAVTDPYASVNAAERALSVREPPIGETHGTVTKDVLSAPVYCDQLYEVPALRGVKVAQAVAGARSSFVRTEGEGRVLAWGANEFGQLGLGSNMTIDTITIPTEVVFTRSVSGGRNGKCVGIATGGDLTFFLVERLNSSTGLPSTDLLACGMGQWGALGNGMYTTAQGTPTKVRAVSGLMEYSETTQSLQPIPPHAITVSPTGHVLLTLDTLSRAGTGGPAEPGRDLLVWGLNREYQLGNGKRASSATPGTIDIPVTASLPKNVTEETSKNAASIPKTQRLMLRTKIADVKDMSGKLYKKGVKVDQKAVAGWGSSLVYWRIC